MISKHPLADCENCPLATQPYYSQPLNEDAAVVFVGSGPVLNEGFKGGFLYGADAGKLIRSVCNVHNIPIENITYTTAVKCAGFADLKLSDKRKAMAACEASTSFRTLSRASMARPRTRTSTRWLQPSCFKFAAKSVSRPETTHPSRTQL